MEWFAEPYFTFQQYETACDIATRKDLNEIIIILQSIKAQKGSKKKQKKTSDTSDSDKRSKENKRTDHDPVSFHVFFILYVDSQYTTFFCHLDTQVF